MKKITGVFVTALVVAAGFMGGVFCQAARGDAPVLKKAPARQGVHIEQTAVAQRALAKPPDLTITKFEVCKRFDKNTVATFAITFKNIGEGPSPCFDWMLFDSKGGAKVTSVCPGGSGSWLLQPGAEKVVTGTIRKSDVWAYPAKPGYVSHFRAQVNKGSKEPKVNETTGVNNGSDEVDIFWDATGVQNYQCTPFE